jgi:hypothetical protein
MPNVGIDAIPVVRAALRIKLRLEMPRFFIVIAG